MEGQQDELFNCELNLIWQDMCLVYNLLVVGYWLLKLGEVFMEEGLVKWLNVKFGDSVIFMGDIQVFSVKVISLC